MKHYIANRHMNRVHALVQSTTKETRESERTVSFLLDPELIFELIYCYL